MRKKQTKFYWEAKVLFFFVLILSISSSILIGCKKDNNQIEKEVPVSKAKNTEVLAKAKNWYAEQQKKQKITIRLKKGLEIVVILKPDWENAKVIQVGDIVAISTTLRTNLIGYDVDKYYALVMKMDGAAFESKILDISSKDSKENERSLTPLQMYQAAFTTQDLSTDGLLNAKIKVFNMHFKNQSNVVYSENGKNVLPLLSKTKIDKQIQQEEQQCYDAYMVTRVYDYYGNLIDIYQEYMGFQICSDKLHFELPGNGGGGSGNQPDSTSITLDFGETTTEDLGSTLEENGVDTIESRNRTWKFHTAITRTYHLESTERIGVLLKNGVRIRPYSIVHKSTKRVGNVYYGDVKYIFGPAGNGFHLSGDYAVANITYTLYIHIDTPFYNQVHDSEPYLNYALWDKNFVLQ